MKRIHHISKALLLTLAMLVCSVQMISSQVSHSVTYGSNHWHKTTHVVGGLTFEQYDYDGLYSPSEPGQPLLPSEHFTFSVPYNAENLSVTLTSASTSDTVISHPIFPCPLPIPCDNNYEYNPDTLVIDSAIYTSNALWPSTNVQILGDGFLLGDNRVVTVGFNPVQYNPVTGLLRRINSASFQISYTIGEIPDNILVSFFDDLRAESREQIKQLVVNSNQVDEFSMNDEELEEYLGEESSSGDANAGGVEPGGSEPGGNNESGEYDRTFDKDAQYLIVTTESLAPAFKRLAALKRQRGYTVQIKTVDEILNSSYSSPGDVLYNNYSNTNLDTIHDDAAKIRAYLRYMKKQHNTKYVLFGSMDIPYRVVIGIGGVPTDNYFSDLTSIWKIEQNRYLSRFFYPDLYVGRLLCTNTNQVVNNTSKVMRYMLNPGNGNVEYLGRALITTGLDQATPTNVDTTNTINHIIDLTKSIYSNTRYINEIAYQEYPTGTDLIDSLNQVKRNFISLNNHGAPNNITTYGIRKNASYDNIYMLRALDHETFGNTNRQQITPCSGLDNLNNKWEPSIMYSISCEVAPFDLIPPYSEHCSVNFAQSFTLGKDYGGPAFIGNSRNGYIPDSYALQSSFLSQLKRGNLNLGIAEALSKVYSVSYFPSGSCEVHVSNSHNLIGDPELEIWTEIPGNYESISVVRTNNGITVQSNRFNESTYVAFCANDSTIKKVKVNNGEVSIANFSPNSTIMAFQHNFIPYIAPLLLQNERVVDERYIIASDVTAGNHVDSNRTSGDYVIGAGSDIEIEHKGTITLAPGFKVEKGASFRTICSDY